MRALCLLLVMALAAPLPAYAQSLGLQVSPVLIDIPAERAMSSFRLRNARDTEASFEVEVFAWTQENGETILTPSTDLIVAPSVFLVAAQREQIVRLGVSSAARGGAIERSYRILVRELPSADTTGPGLQVQVEMSMPVFVRPRGAAPTLALTRVRDANGAPAIRLTNSGASRVSLSQHPEGDNVDGMPRYLLAGQSVVRPITPGQRAVNILFADATSTTPHERRFELDDAPVISAQR